MILLTTNSETLTLTTTSVQDIDVTISALDITTTSSTPVSQDTAITSIASTTILSAPAASTQRQVKSIMITNKGTAVNTITLNKYNGSTYKISPTFTLYPSEAFYYNDYDGFFKTNSAGSKVTESIEAQYYSGLRTCENFAQSNIIATTQINTVAKGSYIGEADIEATSIKVRWRCTVATTGVTYAEIALLKSPYYPRGGGSVPQPILIGYTSIATEVTATGLYTTTINVASGQKINKGDGLYVIFCNNSSGATVTIRGTSSNSRDEIDVYMGTTMATAGTQPSLSVGTIYPITLANTSVWTATQLIA